MPATDPIRQHEALVAELRANLPAAPERLEQRVLAASAPGRRRFSLPRGRRLGLVVVPVAVALAVGAALIHGLLNSGSPTQPTEKRYVLSGLAAPGPTHQAAGTVTTAEQGLSANTRSYASPVPLAATRGRLVHADASLQVRVTNRTALSHAVTKATRIVDSLGGYPQSVNVQSSPRRGNGSAYLALRVPVNHVQKAVTRLSGIGTLVDEQLSTQDLESRVAQESNQIVELRAAVAAYVAALQSQTLPASQRVILEVRLANARRSLAQSRHAHTATLASAATANISLSLTTRQQAAVVHHKQGRLGRMLGSAAHFLAVEGEVVLYALVVLSPFLIIGGLGWGLLRERRRRDERRLLAGA